MKSVNLNLASFLLLLAFVSPSVSAEDWTLQRLMPLLAQVTQLQASFTETKTMALLKQPMVSTGTLAYKKPDYVEKRVLSPQTSYFIVSGNDLTIGDAEKGERKLVLFQYPFLEAFAEAMRATLAGNIKTLKQFYDTELGGNAENWHLNLTPLDEEMLLYVKHIVIRGSGHHITQVETIETNDDRSVMTINHSSE